MNTVRNILLTIVIVMLVSLLVAGSGCAVHAEATMGAGTGSKYAAAMSGRRGAGIDWPADSTQISSKSKKVIGRGARD